MWREPDPRRGVIVAIRTGYRALSQNTTELRLDCLAKAQSAQGRRFKSADEEIRLAYENLAKCWASVAGSIPETDEEQPLYRQ